ncbi:MAG: outer membrane protein assembly factor BamA [Bacillota bacterium]|nr:MAG: outer membrane protein assembly factor BamA [Bacillota bacterium]
MILSLPARGASTPYQGLVSIQRRLSLLLLVVLLLSSPSLTLHACQTPSRESEVIQEIRLQGLDRLGTAEVLARMKIRPGDRWDPAALDAEYRRLWTSGDFVSIESPLVDHTASGVIITITLRERRQIFEVKFEGAQDLSEKAALRQIRSNKDELHDPLLVREDIDSIRDLLLEQGHPFARVDSRTEETTDGLVVIFEIDEGPQVLLRTIDLKGSGSLPIANILKLMQLRTKTPLGLLRSGKFDPRLLEEDLEKIREYYTSMGFFDAEVSVDQLEFQNNLENLRLVIDVEEGPRYRIGEIEFSIEGSRVIPETELRATLAVAPGDLWNGALVKEDTGKLKGLYNGQGYLDATITPTLTYPLEGVDVILRYRIHEGSLVYVSDIEFRGNTNTRDDVIRRQLEIYPGELLHPDLLQTSLSNIHSLRYFDGVRTQFDSGGDPDRRPVVFEVAEGSTGRAMFGVGYSSARGAVGNLAIEKRNFDITDVPDSLSDLPGSFTGGGQSLILEARPGTQYSLYRLQFSEPYLGGSQNSLRISAFRSVLLRPDYIEDRSSAGITVGRLFSLEEKLRGTVGFRNDRISVNDVSTSAPDVVSDSAGKTTYSAIDLNLDWDRRVYRPVIGAVDGWYLETGYSHIGGPLGGNLEIGKFSLGTGLFRTIHENSDELRHIFAMRTSFNWAEPLGEDDFIPVFERFYLGGPRSLRGFDYRGAGPRENDAEIGGTVRHRGSVEYTWPLLDNTLRGIVFTDFGNLSDGKAAFSLDEYRVGVGGGIVLNIPIFGQPLPISFTWTEAVKKEEGDRLVEFSVDLGWFLY